MTDHEPPGSTIRRTSKDPRLTAPPTKIRLDAIEDAEIKAALKAVDRTKSSERQRLTLARRTKHAFPERTLRWPVRRLDSVDFVDCDLPGSRIDGGLFGRIRITNSTFQRVRLNPFEGNKLDVSATRFDRVDFASTVYATLRGSTFVRCLFERCDLRYLTLDRCEFDEVIFDRIRTTRTRFKDSRLVGGGFTGRIGTLFFIETTLIDVDFSASSPTDIVLHGSTLKSVRFPQTRDAFVLLKPRFVELGHKLLGRLSPGGHEVLRSWIAMFDVVEQEPLLIGREILAPFKDSRDRTAFIDAMHPHALAKIDYFVGSSDRKTRQR